MLKKAAITTVAVLMIVLAPLHTVRVAAATDSRAFISDLGDRVIELLNKDDATGAKRKAELAKLFSSAFDVRAMARFVVARHWRAMDAKQKQAYVEAFRDYIVNSYAAKFAAYAGHTFEVYMSRDINAEESLVDAAVIDPNGSHIKVAFRVRTKGGRMSIVDVTVSGVSLLVTKRSEFSSVIEREGADGLIQRLQNIQANRAKPAA